LVALLAVTNAASGPITVDYELSALATPSRFEYRYTITNVAFATPVNWFSVDFDTALYDESSLAITSVGLSDWTEQVLASVPGLPAQYDAYKGTGAALGIGDSAAGFTVQFTWLGSGTPNAQAYTIWDASTFEILGTGTTTAVGEPPPPNPAPEPTTIALVLAALGGVAVGRRCARPGSAAGRIC
jgi:hypothetical protein